MKNSVFYGLCITLILTSFISIIISGITGQITQFFGVLIAVLFIATILLVSDADLGFDAFLGFLALALFIPLVIGIMAMFINAPGISRASPLPVDTAYVLGVRIMSLIYPTTVLVIGAIDRNDRSVKQKAKAKN